MHVHLPKPLHGWRAFAGEVGIIVLGVLIALGAEQFVQGAHQRGEARDAERAIRSELEGNMARLRSRHAVRACVERRLDDLQGLIDSAGTNGGSITTPKWVGRPQFWTMQLSRWQATSEAGRAALISPDDLNLYGSMYSFMERVTARAPWNRMHGRSSGRWSTCSASPPRQRSSFRLPCSRRDISTGAWKSGSSSCRRSSIDCT